MFVEELSNLRELRELNIGTRDRDKSMLRDFAVSLSNLRKIQKIDICHYSSIYADTAMWEAACFVLPRSLGHLKMTAIYFSKMPSCINPSSLPNLSALTLWVNTVDEQDMKHLARLPALSYLHLHLKSTINTSIINAGGNDGCFQKLRHFEINAMVQLKQHNQDDSCISLHIWNREGGLHFGSGKSICSKNVPSAMMPNLEVLVFHVPLRALKVNNGDCANIGLEYLPSLREVKGWIDCEAVSVEEVDAALAALRHSCKVHSNHPTLNMRKFYEDKMVSTQVMEEEKQLEEVYAALAAMRHACKVHPNDPTLKTFEFNKDKMVSTQVMEEEKQQEEAEMLSQAVNDIDLAKLSPASS